VMCLCIRSLIALVLVMVYIIPNPLDYFHISPMSSQLSASPKYFIDTPTENPMILDSNIDLGCEDNMFSMLGGIAINFGSLGCFSGFNASLDPYCMCLGDLPTKITWTTCFNPSYVFLFPLIKLRGYLYSLVWFSLLPLTFYFMNCDPRSLTSSYVL